MQGGNGWGSNPPRLATRPATGVEDREALRDLTTPRSKDNRRRRDWQDWEARQKRKDSPQPPENGG